MSHIIYEMPVLTKKALKLKLSALESLLDPSMLPGSRHLFTSLLVFDPVLETLAPFVFPPVVLP